MDMANSILHTHEGVSCDGCNATAFPGARYKCLRCNDYDLCLACYRANRFGEQIRLNPEIQIHDQTHAMQMMLSPGDFEIVYENDPTKNYDVCKIAAFTCPYCNQNGFSIRTFGTHVTTVHSDPMPYSVICPVCLATPDLEHSANRDTENLKHHWQEFHATNNDTYRVEATTRGISRRPMLARRTQRQTGAGNRAVMTDFATWPNENYELDMNDLLQTMRTAGQEPRTGANLNLLTQTLSSVRELRNQPTQRSNTTGGNQTAAEGQANNEDAIVEQVIRPLRSIPIYVDSSDVDTSNPNGGAANNDTTSSTAPQPAPRPEIIYPQFEGQAIQVSRCRASRICDSDSDFELHMASDNDASSDEEVIDDKGFRAKPSASEDLHPEKDEIWKELREKLTKDEIEIIIKSLKAEQTKFNDNDIAMQPEEPPSIPRRIARMGMSAAAAATAAAAPAVAPLPGAAVAAAASRVAGIEDGEQAWLPLMFEGPPLKNYGCASYWADNRYLRQRKFQREKSLASSNRDGLDKSEVALAVCRSICTSLPLNLRAYDRPDKTMRRTLRHLNLGRKPDVPIVIAADESNLEHQDEKPDPSLLPEHELPATASYLMSVVQNPSLPVSSPEAPNVGQIVVVSSDSSEEEEDDASITDELPILNND